MAKIEKVSKFLGVVITTTTTTPIWILYTWKNTCAHNLNIPISQRERNPKLANTQTHPTSTHIGPKWSMNS
jgi:hypothetical protein